MNRNLARNLWLLGPVLVGALALAPGWSPQDPQAPTIDVWSPGLVCPAATGAMLWLAGLFALNLLTGGRRGPHLVGAGILAAVLALGIGFSTVLMSIRWTPYGAEMRGADGTSYVSLSIGFGESSYAIARRRTSSRLVSTYEILATGGPCDYPDLPRVVRPKGLAPTGGLIVRNGVVAILGSDPMRCVAAVREGGGALVDARRRDDNDEFATPMLEASPFFLVGPDDEIEDADVQALADAISTAPNTKWGSATIPTDEGLVEALDAPNPRVRAAAARLVRADQRIRYPRATARLPR